MKRTRLNLATALLAVSLIGCSLLAFAEGVPQSAANFLVAGTVVDSQSHAPLGHVRVDLSHRPRLVIKKRSCLPKKMDTSRSQ